MKVYPSIHMYFFNNDVTKTDKRRSNMIRPNFLNYLQQNTNAGDTQYGMMHENKLTISFVCIKTNSANPLSRIHAVGSSGSTGSAAAFFAIVFC